MTRPDLPGTWNRWRTQPLFLYGMGHAALFLTIFIALGHLFYYGPGALERHVALQILSGKMPYIDFPSEYPPLAYLGFLLPALLFREPVSYSFAFAAELLIADIVIMALLAALSRRLKLSVRNTLLVYTLLVLAVGPLVITRYDILPTMLMLAGIHAFVTRRTNAAWGLIALGTAAKLFPVVVAPLFALYHLHRRQYARLLTGGAVFAVVVLLSISPWLVRDAGSLLTFIGYHAQRGLHSESTYGTVLLVMQAFQFIKMQASLTFGSWNLVSPVADKLAGYSFYVSVAALFAVYGACGWRLLRSGAASPDKRAVPMMITFSSMAVVVFWLGNKVFSPQYLVWACPLLALATGRYRLAIVTLFIVAAALTQYIFPYHYIEFEMFQPYLVFMAFARNLILGTVLVLLLMATDVRKGRHGRVNG